MQYTILLQITEAEVVSMFFGQRTRLNMESLKLNNNIDFVDFVDTYQQNQRYQRFFSSIRRVTMFIKELFKTVGLELNVYNLIADYTLPDGRRAHKAFQVLGHRVKADGVY